MEGGSSSLGSSLGRVAEAHVYSARAVRLLTNACLQLSPVAMATIDWSRLAVSNLPPSRSGRTAYGELVPFLETELERKLQHGDLADAKVDVFLNHHNVKDISILVDAGPSGMGHAPCRSEVPRSSLKAIAAGQFRSVYGIPALREDAVVKIQLGFPTKKLIMGTEHTASSALLLKTLASGNVKEYLVARNIKGIEATGLVPRVFGLGFTVLWATPQLTVDAPGGSFELMSVPAGTYDLTGFVSALTGAPPHDAAVMFWADANRLDLSTKGLRVLQAIAQEPQFMYNMFSVLVMARLEGVGFWQLADAEARGQLDFGFASSPDLRGATLLFRMLASLVYLHENHVIVNDAHSGNWMCTVDPDKTITPRICDIGAAVMTEELSVLELSWKDAGVHARDLGVGISGYQCAAGAPQSQGGDYNELFECFQELLKDFTDAAYCLPEEMASRKEKLVGLYRLQKIVSTHLRDSDVEGGEEFRGNMHWWDLADLKDAASIALNSPELLRWIRLNAPELVDKKTLADILMLDIRSTFPAWTRQLGVSARRPSMVRPHVSPSPSGSKYAPPAAASLPPPTPAGLPPATPTFTPRALTVLTLSMSARRLRPSALEWLVAPAHAHAQAELHKHGCDALLRSVDRAVRESLSYYGLAPLPEGMGRPKNPTLPPPSPLPPQAFGNGIWPERLGWGREGEGGGKGHVKGFWPSHRRL